MGYQTHDVALKHMQDSTILLMTNFPQESSKGLFQEKFSNIWQQEKRFFLSVPKDADVENIERNQSWKTFWL